MSGWTKDIQDWWNGISRVDSTGGRALKVMQATPYTANQPAGSDAVDTFTSLTTSDTGEVVKALPGNVYGYYVGNNTATAFYLKFYNKATAPTAADTPVRRVLVPASGSAFIPSNSGIWASFSAGISVRSVNELADAGTTSPVTPPIVNIFYK